jgi:hypothetical protein
MERLASRTVVPGLREIGTDGIAVDAWPVVRVKWSSGFSTSQHRSCIPPVPFTSAVGSVTTAFLRFAVPSGMVASSAPLQLSTCPSLRVVLLFRCGQRLYICYSQTAFFWRIGPWLSTSAIC